MTWSGCKSLRRFLKAGARRMDAPRGRDLQGRFIAPDPKAVRNKLRAPRSGDFLAGSPGRWRLSRPSTFTGNVLKE